MTQIIDFNSGQGDKIGLGGLSDQEFTFVADSAFTGGNSGPELRYDLNGGQYVVQGDLDGDGVADFQFIVTASSFSGSDFILG